MASIPSVIGSLFIADVVIGFLVVSKELTELADGPIIFPQKSFIKKGPVNFFLGVNFQYWSFLKKYKFLSSDHTNAASTIISIGFVVVHKYNVSPSVPVFKFDLINVFYTHINIE